MKIWRVFDRWGAMMVAILALFAVIDMGFKISHITGIIAEMQQERVIDHQDYQLLTTYVINLREKMIASGVAVPPLPIHGATKLTKESK